MDHSTELPTRSIVETKTLGDTFERIPQLIDREVIQQMINHQVTAIDRLESTNKSLANCNTLAQNKLATTSSLFKKTSKQLNETKRDLDIIYKKILDLKAKVRADKLQ